MNMGQKTIIMRKMNGRKLARSWGFFVRRQRISQNNAEEIVRRKIEYNSFPRLVKVFVLIIEIKRIIAASKRRNRWLKKDMNFFEPEGNQTKILFFSSFM